MLNVKMVIAQFRPFIGGAELQAELLAKTLRKRDVDVEVFTQRSRGVPPRLPDDPVTVHRLWVPGYRWVKVFLFIRAFNRALISCYPNVDIIHAHQAGYPAFAAVLAARRLGVPVIVKCTNSGPRFDLDMLAQALPFGRNMARYIARHTTRFIALNEQTTEQLAEWKVEKARIVHIPNGVFVSNASNDLDKSTLRASLKLSQESFITVAVGSLTGKKDFLTLLKAMARHRADNYLKLLLIGDGPLGPHLKARADDLGISSKVTFLGQISPPAVRTYLSAADCFILPSITEGISNALLEAMAAGLPCIVSAIPGNIMLIRHLDTGLHFKIRDPDSLLDSISLIRADTQLRNSLGQKARQRILSEFKIEVVADSYTDLYKELLSEKSQVHNIINNSSNIKNKLENQTNINC